MSLFPAYATVADDDGGVKLVEKKKRRWESDSGELQAAAVLETAADSEAREAVLLASDSDEGPALVPPPAPLASTDLFYLDTKPDSANVGVVTLYYPGRPIYKKEGARRAGKEGAARRRYFHAPVALTGPAAGAAPLELATRARSMRALLTDSPADEELWLRYIQFQEEWGDAAAWLEASEEAARAVRGPAPRGARLRAQRHRARRAALAPPDLLDAFAQDLKHEECPAVQLECWMRLVWALGADGGAAAAAGAERDLERAALAALASSPHAPHAYPHILYAYGSWLRAAGLWERLVLLMELVCAMNFPPSAEFPPAAPPSDAAADAERRLQEAEDVVLASGLPLSAVWVRVERLRAAAHWRAPPVGGAGAGELEADPQRAPAAGEVAALVRGVRPGATLAACVSLLRLARVPLLPRSEACVRACTDGTAAGAGEEDAGAALLALGRAARRLPTGHSARVSGVCSATALRRSLATLLDPPHYFSDTAGYLAWTRALWSAACGWTAGEDRAALVCWRLRYLHAVARLAEGAERRRLRGEARATLKTHGAGDATAFALFARLEAECGDANAAITIALQAVRASAGVAGVARERALFAARVLRELAEGAGAGPEAGSWALCCAALGRSLPPQEALATGPPAALFTDALAECSRRCAETERALSEGAVAGVGAAAAAALGAGGAGEWGAARAALLSPRDRHVELQRLRHTPYDTVHRSAWSVQYYEQCACALVLAAAREAGLTRSAAQLRALFPNNALLALACSGAPVWAVGASSELGAPRTHATGWARVLPALLRAPVDNDAEPAEMARVARACAAGAGEGAGGAALAALRLEAEARAPRGAAHRVLLAALADHPEHKWLYMRGAAWVPAQAEALGDAALERGLRAHALLHELRAPPPSPATCTTTTSASSL